MVDYFYYLYISFHTTVTELSCCNRDYGPQSLKYWPFIEKKMLPSDVTEGNVCI